MEYVFVGIFVLMFVGACFICTTNYYAVVAGLGMVAIAILLSIWATADVLEEPTDAHFEEV
jgi:hypothetical protein